MDLRTMTFDDDKIYFYKITQDSVSFQLGVIPTEYVELQDRNGKRIVSLSESGELTVYKGYAWDGATPKWRYGPVMFGTWDGRWDHTIDKPDLWESTLIHDSLLQLKEYRPVEMESVEWKDIDDTFLAQMQAVEFKYASLYYTCVRWYHKLWRKPKMWLMRK